MPFVVVVGGGKFRSESLEIALMLMDWPLKEIQLLQFGSGNDRTTDVESDEESSTDNCVIPARPPSGSDDGEDVEDSLCIGFSPVVAHTETLKCIGSTKEDSYQEVLTRVTQLRNAGQEIETLNFKVSQIILIIPKQ